MNAENIEQWRYIAKIAQLSERFQDMIEAVKHIVYVGHDALNVEDRNLLSVAYKNYVCSRRAALRVMSFKLKAGHDKEGYQFKLLSQYKQKIEAELHYCCNEILTLLDNHLLPKAQNQQQKIFYLKMKEDYYKYISEYSTQKDKEIAMKKSEQSYKLASELTASLLGPVSPIRLGLALSKSVFTYQMDNNPKLACQIAKKAFDEALLHIEDIKQSEYKDVTTIMQLLRDNLDVWAYQNQAM